VPLDRETRRTPAAGFRPELSGVSELTHSR
jgi:hypothetical protein